MPCAAYLKGEYGVKGLYVGVPAVIGAGGIERVVELKLSGPEKRSLDRSVDAVRKLVDACKVLRKQPAAKKAAAKKPAAKKPAAKKPAAN